MNSTSTNIPLKDNIQAVIFFLVGCATLLVSLILILFAKIDKDSKCFAIFKFIKIKIIKICCCCCGRKRKNEMIEENAMELKEILNE